MADRSERSIDPARGGAQLDQARDGAQIDRARDRAQFAWLWRTYVWPLRWWLAAAFVLMAIEGAVLGVVSYLMQPMFDRIFVAGQTSAIWTIGLAILGVFCVRAFATTSRRGILQWVGESTAAGLRSDLLRHAMTLDIAWHQAHPPGALLERVQGDVQALVQGGKQLVTGIGKDIVSLIALFSVAISVDPIWTLVACLGVPLVISPAVLVQGYIRSASRKARVVASDMSLRLDEIFHGIAAVKLNRLEGHQSTRFDAMVRKRTRIETRAETARAVLPGLIDVITGLGFLAVLVYGGGQIAAGEKTVGQFMSFFTAMALAFDPIRRLSALSGVAQTCAASLDRLRAVLDARSAIAAPTRSSERRTPGDITFDDVRLSYGETKVLRGLDFTARAGETTALVGPSGAGKSSVFNVLTRLVDPHSGQVRLDGTPLPDIALEDLRDMISVVSQETALFDESIRDNILLGLDVPEAELRRALDAAFVTEFVETLPDGLDTPAGPRGSALSGGQRQRIAIARALLRNRPILLLDEATSALDTQSEAKVQGALDALSAGRTTLVIAHRLSTIRGADRIVVIEEGRVQAVGPHEDLLATSPLYARLAAAQGA
ncbi:MAG: ABC transporter ATP-binding protein [Shimia sp.]